MPVVPRSRARVLSFLVFLVATGVAVGFAARPSAWAADSSKPAREDSNPRTRTKSATLTTAVTPEQAKPGDEVLFKVMAKLKPGYHIYKYSKTEGAGPVTTSFDFFNTAGLKIEADWVASQPPEQHKDPNFTEVDFVEYHEGEVTWSVKLRVPTDAEPGKRTLLCQARYMVCDAKTCSLPGQWTLPEAVLTVVRADAAAATSPPAAEQSAGTSARTADLPKPAREDSSPRTKPKSATLTTAVTPEQARPGDEVIFKVTAKLKPDYHIYKFSKTEGAGPVTTSFDFFSTAGLKIEGDWVASQPPEQHKDPNFTEVEFVEYHEGEVTWSVKLRVPTDAEPGKKTLLCQARYMVCDAKTCSLPGQWTLPEAVLTVVRADAPATNSPPAARQSAGPQGAPAPGQADQRLFASRDRSSAPTGQPADSPNDGPAAAPAPNFEASSASPKVDPSVPANQSEIAQRAQAGLIPFLLAAALGGVFALVMPCVWPMVPITVNFFVKQGHGPGGRKKSTGLAVTYCLSIIAVFTAVGVLCSFFFSASSLQTLANNPWLNLFVAALFITFGLSLLGLFELRLPSFLLNASARNESRGGLVGVFFMALTLTITSFTCTFPVVGGLLVMAAGGDFLYPIIGLATFATVLALPFFLLALSPSLISRMPRSGDWMNAVKVVGGLVEIGAALKFLNTAELAYVIPENAWFNARVVLTCWIALSVVCGLYLLGLFRTDHDHDEVKVGPGRLIFGAFFLALALFMAPALFGRLPQSVVWNRLIVGILPPDASELGAGGQLAVGAGDSGLTEVKATSSDPAQAEREEKKVHGVVWGMSFEQARERARAENKPILIDFTGVNCANCRAMESGVFPRPEVVSLLKKFVTVQLYTDFVPIGSITKADRERLSKRNQERLLDLAKEATNPIYVVLSPGGEVIGRLGGFNEPPVFVDFLSKALGKASSDLTVAQAGSSAGPPEASPSATENGKSN
jgi:thiol:disulfide interchange protein DsbD